MEEGVKHSRCFVLFLTGDAPADGPITVDSGEAVSRAVSLRPITSLGVSDSCVFVAHRGTETGTERATDLWRHRPCPRGVSSPV